MIAGSGVTLITGFGPFPDMADNPAALIAHRLQAEGLEAHVLPAEYKAGLERFQGLLERTDPDIVICFGVDRNVESITLERVARNAVRADLPDAAGAFHDGVCVDPDGPETCAATLPLDRIAGALQDKGIPWRASDDCNSYICNFLFYQAMKWIGESGRGRMGGFVHVPLIGANGFTEETLLTAARVIVETCRREALRPALGQAPAPS